jgi:hypothetical protein
MDYFSKLSLSKKAIRCIFPVKFVGQQILIGNKLAAKMMIANILVNTRSIKNICRLKGCIFCIEHHCHNCNANLCTACTEYEEQDEEEDEDEDEDEEEDITQAIDEVTFPSCGHTGCNWFIKVGTVLDYCRSCTAANNQRGKKRL